LSKKIQFLILILRAVSSGLFFALLIFSQSAQCQEGQLDENKIIIAYIYQFTNYIEWPERAVNATATHEAEPFVISVIGNPSLQEELEQLAQKKMVKSRPIKIEAFVEPGELKRSQVVLFGGNDVKLLQKILAKTKNTAALVITNAAGFAQKGAMINFFVDDSRLRFEVNRAAIEKENLRISSQLLKLAKLVD
jgi:hypothetical protein